MRHVLAEALLRGEVHEPLLAGRSITVSEVRVSRDLKAATVFAAELGRPLSEDAARGLRRAVGHLAGRLAREMNLKYAPRLEFVADPLFDTAAHMERLIGEERDRIRPEEDEDDGEASGGDVGEGREDGDARGA
jgi:ribosome-binding factor A